MKKFEGTGVALITPFNEDTSVDFEALEKLVNYQIDNGINYLVVGGTTGEPITLSRDELLAVRNKVIETNKGRLPLVCGIGGNNTAALVEEMQTADLSYFDAILSVSPYYNKPTQEGIYQHYKTLSEASPKPIIVYNVPGRTASNILPTTTIRLANDFQNIIGIKEAGNNVLQYLELIKSRPKEFLVISGDDDLAPDVVLAGASGVISVMGQGFPKEFSKMIQLGLEGKAKEAYQYYYRLMDGISLIFKENNPAGIKSILKEIGLCKNEVRLPLVRVSDTLQKEIANFVKNF
ncbi:MAG: 4-hydroxy-tetrahydrodipicolinate synthase [Flavobacteriaceae bacterium]|nr:MAG: 4-hydroxy-tetrahydrodipicolinate synthase [Flavobacteriaceae bacterium]